MAKYEYFHDPDASDFAARHGAKNPGMVGSFIVFCTSPDDARNSIEQIKKNNPKWFQPPQQDTRDLVGIVMQRYRVPCEYRPDLESLLSSGRVSDNLRIYANDHYSGRAARNALEACR